ncbi:hypothetical protein SDC9_102767 [bioreactor metagenome]|uniref:Uncharacterized protein n=1 Tax=bioreactor metagenome TaxID=1076179 RepID=A0A645ASC3_9ZZZZ
MFFQVFRFINLKGLVGNNRFANLLVTSSDALPVQLDRFLPHIFFSLNKYKLIGLFSKTIIFVHAYCNNEAQGL